MPSERTVQILWAVALVGGVAVQAGLGAVDGTLAYLVTMYALWIVCVAVYRCGCCRVKDEESEHSPVLIDLDMEPQELPQEVKGEESEYEPVVINLEPQELPQEDNTTRPPARLYFLDNVKVWLTALVVSHHVTCAFGGCGSGWFLVVGEYSCPFQWFATSFTLLNQAYFMPLFFFISAYFCPKSYDRKGQSKFFQEKAQRILYPATVCALTIVPLSSILGQVVADEEIIYIPQAGQCWFLFWLLIFMWAYSTIREAEKPNSILEQETSESVLKPFPRPVFRYWVAGVLVCGVATLVIMIAVGGVFFAMPITVGSLPCDILMFTAGVLASRNDWLTNLPDRLNMSVLFLRIAVFIEGSLMVALLFAGRENGAFYLPFFLVAGVFCVDMCIATLQFFQQYANTTTRLSEAAYTVYLIHPLVITGVTAAFVEVYNHLYDKAIVFGDDDGPISTSQLEGPGEGSLHLFVGWLVVSVVSHLICWPLAWYLRRLPYLNQVL
jgi:glucan biosynthesis protein C